MSKILNGLFFRSITIVVGLMIGVMFFASAPAYAADGSGTNTVSPTSTTVSSTGNTFTFTSTAAEEAMNSGGISITVPSGWPAPTLTAGVEGYIVATSTSGMIDDVVSNADVITGWAEDDNDACNTVNLSINTTTYKEGIASILCGNSASAAPDNTDSFGFRYGANQDWSAYTKVGVWLYSTVAVSGTTNYLQVGYDDATGALGDGGALEVFNVQSLAANTWTYFTFDLTAARTAVREIGIVCRGGGCDSKNIFVDYILIGPGLPTISGTGPWTIDANFLTMPSSGTTTIIYGSGGGANAVTAPSTAGDYTFTTQSRIDGGGVLTNIVSSPVIQVRNPIPTTTGISPSSKIVGDAQFSMTVNGTNFVSASVVRFNGADRTTTFSSSTQLTATIPASDMTVATTTAQITVFNPTPGGGTSNAQTFSVLNPSPTTSGISPTSTFVGDATTTLTVTGTGFNTQSLVRLNGTNRTTAYVNATTVQATLLPSDSATATTSALITVFNPTPGGGTSNAQTFSVNKRSTTITVGSSAISSVYGNTITFTATTTPASDGPATGTVTFKNGGVTMGTGVLSGNIATYSTSSLKVTGSPYSITAVYDGDNTFLGSTSTAISQVITTKALTVTGMLATTKTYDATTTVTLSGGTLNGIVGSDVVSINTRTGSFNDKNASTSKQVTVTSVTLTGADASNYTVTNPTNVTGTITPKALAVTATGTSKTYDATTTAVVTLSDDRISGDIFTSTSTSATFTDKNVANNKLVTVTGISISGTDSGNYTPNTTATTTANIAARTLAISATGVNKTYDGTTAASVTLSDNRIGGDIFSIASTSVTFADKNFGTTKLVTVSGLSISGTDSGNYSANTTATTTANISKLSITVTAATNTKEYDRTTTASSTPTVTVGSIQTGDTASFSESYDTKNVGTNKTLTPTGSVSDGNGGLNYTVTFANNTTGVITAKALTVTATGISKTYDATTTASVTLSAMPISGDSVTATSTGAAFADKNVGAGKTVTVSGITIGGTDGANYSAANSTTTATANIEARALTVTAQTNTKVYDQTTTATTTPTITVGALQGSDTAAFTETYDNKNVGTNKTLTPAGSVTDGNTGLNYAVTFANNTTGVITAKGLTVAGMTGVTKEYDQTTTASVTGGDLSGVISGDTVSLNNASTTATFADKNVGTAKPITVSGVALSGTDAGNYSVSNPTGLTASITAKGLTVIGMTGVNKEYDQTTTASITSGSLNGVISGDTVSLNNASTTASFADKNVGTAKPITVSGVALSGTDAGNYSVANPTGLTANITAKGITVAGVTANDKDYDGTTTATVNTGSAVLYTIFGGDDATLNATGVAGAFDTPDVGENKLVTISGLALAGGDGGNYQLAQPTTTATIRNPVPNVTSVSPNEAFVNDPDTVITVSGFALTPATTIRFDGNSLVTTFVNGNTATATIPAAYLTTAGTSTITAFSPTPGGGISTTSAVFYIKNRAPIIATLSPDNAEEGSATTSLTISGNYFSPNVSVTFNGTPLTIDSSSSSTINTNIPASLLAAFGTSTVAVTNPTPGGGTATSSFIITRSAVKFVIINPTDGTVDAPITVTVQAQKANGSLSVNYQQDVTLNASGSATPTSVLINIANGVGTTSISDTVAETVNLSLTDSQSTGLDVSSTQQVVFAHGAAAKFTLAGPSTLDAGARAQFTATRKDQFNNLVTGGADTIAYFYSSSTSTSKLFYDAPTGGGVVTSATMVSGTSTASVWYYDENPGTYTITVSDNTPTPDGLTGIDDATTTLTVQAIATRFVIIDPTDGTVDAPITVTVQAQDNLGHIDGNYQNNVTLLITSTSSQATTTANGLIDIINGVGTISISDTVAETVYLSLADTQSTGLNVASSTQDVIFAPGAVAQFAFGPVSDTPQNVRLQIDVARKDQFGNYVSTGTTPVYFYASPTTTANNFYDALTGGTQTNLVTITGGSASSSIWYGGNPLGTLGTFTITASDNATTPDGTTGIDDVSTSTTVTPVATQLIITDPTDGTVDAPITVNVYARDDNNNPVTSYNDSATLAVTGNAILASGGVITFVDGVATTTLTDTVAPETVTISIIASSTALRATSTQDVFIGVGALSQFTVTDPGDASAGALVEYTATRKDQYGNLITTGVLIADLLVSPTSTSGIFYSSNSTTSGQLTTLQFDNGSATKQFWYYNETLGSYQLTVQSGSSVGSDTIAISPAAAAKLTMNDRVSTNPGSRLQYTITRKDQFNNLVTTGALPVYMYADPTSSSTAFYDAASGGTAGNLVTINDAQSAANVWYYESQSGSYTITASDNATAPDGALGLSDATDSVNVQTATATRFVFASVIPQSLTVGNASVITIEARDDFGNLDTSYGNDVTLVTGVNSAFGTGLSAGTALIDIVGGIGSITLTDNIAETVNLALLDSQGTGLNVSATSAITWNPGATAEFVLNDPGDIVAGNRIGYMVSRRDQFGNYVSAGSDTVHLYSDSLGAHKAFYTSSTTSSTAQFVTITAGATTTPFWYYDEAAGTYTITASDNATAPNGTTGIDDGTDQLIVSAAPIVATRYVIIDPQDVAIGQNTVIVIQTQDNAGALDNTQQEDIVLVLGTSTAVTTPAAVNNRVTVDIINGIGTVSITDTTIETIGLSLQRVAGSTSTLSIASTQDVAFLAAAPVFVGGGGGGVYTPPQPVAVFTGRAYPGAKIVLFARTAAGDIPLKQDVAVAADGTFKIDFSGALKGLEAFGLSILDEQGRVAQTKIYDMNKVTAVTAEKNLYIAPTAGIIQRTVTLGNNVGLTGSAAPGSIIRAEVDGKPVDAQIVVGKDGTYRLLINTKDLAFGGHVVRLKQIDKNGVESDYSTSKVFTVSKTLNTRADLNNNGGVDIGDWSIFLSRFASADPSLRKQVDINGDGKVDIADFSIFIRSTVGR